MANYRVQSIDRSGQCPPIASPIDEFIGYGLYAISIDGNSINLDLRDADYQDGTGGFGTNYSTADIEIWYNVAKGYFYRNLALTDRIVGTIAIWENGRKSTLNSIPITIKSNTDEALIAVDGISNSVVQQKWLVGSSARTVSAISPQTQSGVTFTFSSWSDGGAQTHTISPSSDKFGQIVTANFIPKPSSPPNVQPQGTTGQNPHLVWSIHPSANVSYQIWRAIKPKNQPTQAPELLATLSRNILEYTDDAIQITSSYLYDLVSYDVRSVYTLNGISYYSDPVWYAYFGQLSLYKWAQESTKDASKPLASESKIESISITSHPNPFNPTTVFTYQLPVASAVSLKVYDSVGKEIALLVNENKEAGIHNVTFHGHGLASGIYFAHFAVSPQDGTKNYSETMKIMLAK
ncbi:MAG TPA: T9SS type A sorting domain-containing protein [Nitrosomonas sp.]|nr:T9SS type A sorting domain-containing protein [Nitrosomonas sp.]